MEVSLVKSRLVLGYILRNPKNKDAAVNLKPRERSVLSILSVPRAKGCAASRQRLALPFATGCKPSLLFGGRLWGEKLSPCGDALMGRRSQTISRTSHRFLQAATLSSASIGRLQLPLQIL
jgi:hypothetical protein